jgi:enamine deaminase RidA (YjgF/YER057c/UK114 family)
MALEGDLHHATTSLGGVAVHHLSGRVAAADPRPLLEQLPSLVYPTGATIVSQVVVAPLEYHAKGMEILGERSGGVPWPVTWIDEGSAAASMQACAVAGAPQTRATLEGIEEALDQVGMSFDHVVRTWLFIDRILEWYAAFNGVRTRFFDERGVFDRFLPASTGIGAANSAGRSVVAQAIALRPKSGEVRVMEVESPLQCPATEYRSSFSRAAEVVRGGARQLYVSGTASIDPCGDTVHRGELERQVGHTLDVVAAILGSRGMAWENVLRGIVYYKDVSQAAGFERHCRKRGLPLEPLIVTQGTVCRDDLLFEIEVDALGT